MTVLGTDIKILQNLEIVISGFPGFFFMSLLNIKVFYETQQIHFSDSK